MFQQAAIRLGRSAAIVLLALGGCGDDTSRPADGSTGIEAGVDSGANDAATAEDSSEDARLDDGGVDALPTGALSGEVVYEDRLFDANGFTGEQPLMPARRVEVSVFEGARQIATVLTDDEGRFSLELEGGPYRVRARARAHSGSFAVQARSRSGRVHEMTREWQSGDGPLRFVASVEELGGAFNIVDVSLDAFDAIAPHVATSAPTLSFAWDQGEAWPCGSCYGGNTVSLGGQVEDTDEYDDDIILHEFGHYFVEHFSADDSPGGPHRDRQVSPVLAYGEGVAYFFTLFVTGRSIVVDTFQGSTRTIDFERYLQNGEDRPGFRGTTSGTLDGRLREELIGGILLDAFDEASADEPEDTSALGASGVMDVLVGYFGNPQRDRGTRGIDLADLLYALQCRADISRQEIQRLADERGFPWVAPARCD